LRQLELQILVQGAIRACLDANVKQMESSRLRSRLTPGPGLVLMNFSETLQEIVSWTMAITKAMTLARVYASM